jgi:exonuclease SbcC
MKFKQVKIQAFRAYQTAENGTFDFTTDSGEPADFVSIYAPNGFGKTSFYDAVEWAYTNNLSRFLRKQSDNFLSAKSERNIATESGSETGQFILRNKYAPAKLEGFVELSTTEKKITKKLPRARKGQSDFKYDLAETRNNYFLDVLLSQEWIDAFLREVRAEDRYEKFMTYIGDPAAATRYKLLVRLTNRNQEHLKQLRNETKKLRRKLSQNADSEILIKINEKIRLLKDQGESLPEITASFGDREFSDFSGQIGERLIVLRNEVKMARAAAKKYLAQSGGIDKYLKAKKESKALKENLRDLAAKAELLAEREKLENQWSNLKEKQAHILDELRKYEEIKDIFPYYVQTEEELKEKLFRLRSVEKELKFAEDNIEQIGQNLSELETSLQTLEEKKARLSVQLSERSYPLGFVDEPEITEIENRILNLQGFSVAFGGSDLSKLETDFAGATAAAAKAIEQLWAETNSRATLELQVAGINADIQKRESLDDDLKQLISKGVDLVAKAQLSSCPLCTQGYDSFDALLSKISNNSILSDSLRELFEKKSQIESRLSKLDNSIKDSESKIKRKIESEIARMERKLSSLAESSLENRIKKIRARLAEYKNEKFDAERTVKISRDEIARLNKSLEKSANREKHLKVAEFFALNLGQTDVSIAALENSIEALNSSLSATQANEEATRRKITEINTRLLTVDAAKIKEEIVSKQRELDSLIDLINSFESFVVSELNFDPGQLPDDPILPKKQLSDAFDRARADKKKVADEKAELMKNYKIVDKLKEAVLPFLESNRIENSITQLAGQISAKEAVAAALKAERKNLSEFINKQIESFFYEDLINDLYRKIDPHPAYRKIEFICDFKSDRPRLEVVASNETGIIIPNLYFSTAQLNILSLSIFLAKALNAMDNKGKPVDCIFIDDPIQSMDNINVLSTIDLLRSIVINFNKQIILSTHDDSFHKLLQRKIPENLFKAKYIELETVGRVKADRSKLRAA